MAVWHPATYLQFADERARPFWDLVARIRSTEVGTVVDLGCGPGQLTAALAGRWPGAHIVGIDASAEMIATARDYESDAVTFAVADLRDWHPDEPVDVVVSNATLQWVPGHRDLLPSLLAQVAPGGTLAFAVPGNFAEPTHQLLRDLAADARFAPYTADVVFPSSFDPTDYYTDLLALGAQVDAWESTYLHLLTGHDPVFRWISGTGARPVLQALPDDLRAAFAADYTEALRAAYPEQDYGTLLPFRRVFCVATKPDE